MVRTPEKTPWSKTEGLIGKQLSQTTSEVLFLSLRTVSIEQSTQASKACNTKDPCISDERRRTSTALQRLAARKRSLVELRRTSYGRHCRIACLEDLSYRRSMKFVAGWKLARKSRYERETQPSTCKTEEALTVYTLSTLILAAGTSWYRTVTLATRLTCPQVSHCIPAKPHRRLACMVGCQA